MSIKALVDEYYTLDRQIKALKERQESIADELKDLHDEGEILLGSDGHGYRVGVTRKFHYPASVMNFIDEEGYLSHFASISRAKLDWLAKAGLLTYAQVNNLHNQATVEEVKRLVRFVPEEAKGA